jgi:hypothetical protein
MQAYKPIKYSYLLTSGTPERVREVFFENKDFYANPSLSEDKFDQRVSLVRLDMLDMDFTSPKTHEILCGKRSTVVSFSDQMNATEFLITVPHDPYVTMDFESNCTRELVAEDYDTIEFEYMIPEENQLIWYVAVLFLCSGETKKPTGKITVKAPLIKDGQYHKASVSLPREIWNGKVHKLRFDFFHDAAEGDRMYLKRFRFLKKSE